MDIRVGMGVAAGTASTQLVWLLRIGLVIVAAVEEMVEAAETEAEEAAETEGVRIRGSRSEYQMRLTFQTSTTPVPSTVG